MFYSDIAGIICLVLLAAVSFIHLFVSWDKQVSKPFLLLLIAAYYITSVKRPEFLLIAALLTSWLGDVLLIPQGDKWFTAGGISFMISHFLFVALYASHTDFTAIQPLTVIGVAAVYFGVSAVIIYLVRPYTPKAMIIPMFFYLLANSSMNIFALMQLLSEPCAGTAIAYAGAVLFFISDCSLFMVRNYKNGYFKSYFVVMLTYILGEFMITQGIILLSMKH